MEAHRFRRHVRLDSALRYGVFLEQAHKPDTLRTQVDLSRRPTNTEEIESMDSEELLHLIRWLVKGHSVHSKAENAWILFVPSLKEIVKKEVRTPLSALTAIDETLELGVTRGYWTIRTDHVSHAAIVVTN